MEKPGLTGGILSLLGFSVCDFGTELVIETVFLSLLVGVSRP